jgi:23S rRNA (guanosine2251-2'-O)-methyltransferase
LAPSIIFSCNLEITCGSILAERAIRLLILFDNEKGLEDGKPMANTVEGRNPILEALKAGRPIGKILIAKNIERHGVIGEIIHRAQTGGIPLEWVERQAIDRLSETGSSQGILAFTSAKDYIDLEDLVIISKEKNEPAFYLILDGVEDPQNLGAVLRTADAVGLHGVIIRERRAVGLTPAVEKASAGAVEYVPVARVSNISRTIETLKQNNIWIVGTDPSGNTDYTQVDYKPPTTLVIGGEGRGLSELVKQNCDFLVRIPMRGKISSLNTSVASGIMMYEVMRQRVR